MATDGDKYRKLKAQRAARRVKRRVPYAPRKGSFAGDIYRALLDLGGLSPDGSGATVARVMAQAPRARGTAHSHEDRVIRTITSLIREGVVESLGYVRPVDQRGGGRSRPVGLYRVRPEALKDLNNGAEQ